MSTQTKQQTKINRKAVESLKNLDFEWLIQLNGTLEDLEENQGIKNKDLQDFCEHLDVAVRERCNELINAEKKFKDFLNQSDDIEYEYEKIDEAEKLIKSFNKKYNGRTIEYDVMNLSHKYADEIREKKTFKYAIFFLDSVKDFFESDTRNINKETGKLDNAMFAMYLAIAEVLREIEQAGWVNIEDWKYVNEDEDIELEDYVLDYINNTEKDLIDIDLLKYLTQYGLKDIYVQELEEPLYGEPYIMLQDGCLNQLADVYALC